MNIGNFDFNENRTFIVAELSANHNHNLDTALKSIEAAKEAGADAIKFQTYTPDTLTIDCDNDCFRIKNDSIWDGKTLYQLYKEAYTPWEWHRKLFETAQANNLIYFSTPFDKTAVDFLEELNVPAYKIASFEIFDIPLIEYVASKGKPMIISTGMGTLADIEEAVNAIRKNGNNDIILLKCTSSYPAPVEEANLLTIPHLRDTFHAVPGLSDHTLGYFATVAATALGAKVIEKHFILDRKLGGPDASFSMEPRQFKEMVNAIRDVEKALGKVSYKISPGVKKSLVFARSLFIVKDVKAGEEINAGNVRSIRPGYGLHPKYYNQVLGMKFRKDVERGTPLSWELFE